MSRIVMADRHMFLQLMSGAATDAMPESKLYEMLLDQWWGTVSCGSCVFARTD